MSGLDETGTDITEIKLGMQRTDIEALLGAPIREIKDKNNTTQCLYQYDTVNQAYGDRAILLAVDIASLGLFSVFCSLEDECPQPEYESKEMILEYDENDQLISIQSVTGVAGETTDAQAK